MPTGKANLMAAQHTFIVYDCKTPLPILQLQGLTIPNQVSPHPTLYLASPLPASMTNKNLNCQTVGGCQTGACDKPRQSQPQVQRSMCSLPCQEHAACQHIYQLYCRCFTWGVVADYHLACTPPQQPTTYHQFLPRFNITYAHTITHHHNTCMCVRDFQRQ